MLHEQGGLPPPLLTAHDGLRTGCVTHHPLVQRRELVRPDGRRSGTGASLALDAHDLHCLGNLVVDAGYPSGGRHRQDECSRAVVVDADGHTRGRQHGGACQGRGCCHGFSQVGGFPGQSGLRAMIIIS